jgi:hypothetical protein
MAGSGGAVAGGFAAAKLAREHAAAHDLRKGRQAARQALAALEQLAF